MAHKKNWGKRSQSALSQRFLSTICLVNGWCQGDGFLSVGAQTGAIKLEMAGTYDW